MGKKTAIGASSALCLLLAGLLLYSHFIGFERPPLASKFPSDTLAYLSVRHIRKAGLAFATDDQLQSSVNVIQAIAKTLSDSSDLEDPLDETPDIDPALLKALASHFKTELAIAAFLPENDSPSIPELVIASQFYGSAEAFAKSLETLAADSSNDEVLLSWKQDEWQNIITHQLQVTPLSADLALPDIQLTWAAYQEVLYIATSTFALHRILAFNTKPESQPNLADRLATHPSQSILPTPDLSLFINARPYLDYLTNRAQKDLIKKGGLAASLSPSVLVKELGLTEIDSLYLASNFTSDRKTYSGILYREKRGLLSSIAPFDSTFSQKPENMSIFASESLNIDAGQAILSLKDAFLKAAPLANFPYFGIRSKVLSNTGLNLEETLATAFLPNATLLQTLDTGTARSPYGTIVEQVTSDYALKFRLRENNSLKALVESQIPLLLKSQAPRAYVEDDTLFIDRETDNTITTGRFALHLDEHHLTIGQGTLKSFNTLLNREEIYPIPDSRDPLSHTQVGSGSLSLQNLPTTLFQLATVFYLQVNPGKSIPQEYYQFDWGALTALQQERESRTYDDGQGHLYRVSRQID